MDDLGVKKARESHVWERDELNFYVEPRWVTRRLVEVEGFNGTAADPCCGGGNLILGAQEAGLMVQPFDIVDRGFLGQTITVADFFAEDPPHGRWPVDNIISNPPYGVAVKEPGKRDRIEERFIELALQRARSKVAVFLRSNWDNGEKRQVWLSGLPLYRVYKVSPRPSCPPGRHYYANSGKLGQGIDDYAWYVFLNGFRGHPTVHYLRRDG